MEYSPILAAVTGIFEAGAAAWIFIGRGAGRRRILFPAGLILLLLAGYQFAEVTICRSPEHELWTQLAFLDITWLPPLGLWLGYQIGAPRMRWLRTAALADMALALSLSAWIIAAPAAITRSVCQMVIARYFPTAAFDIAYGSFYQLSLLLTVFAGAAAMSVLGEAAARKHWANLQTGLLGFLFPALAVRILIPETEGILPSVMCHFAIALAVSLVFVVLRERSLPKAGSSGRIER
jgi:hypothetical protein